MNKRAAIVQSSYIPWKGYFDLIAYVDEFILYDDVQFTKRDWRSRNQIKTHDGAKWLTVPVKVKGRYYQTIREVEISSDTWAKSHWGSIYQSYRNAPYFRKIESWLKPIYLENSYTHLSCLNRRLIIAICEYLNIDTSIKSSWDYQLIDGKTERLASICKQANASTYVSGPAARSYIDERIFSNYKIEIEWFEYGQYPEYAQSGGDFLHNVSILDLLFNCGDNATEFMKSTHY